MKKIYIITTILTIVGISSGILFFVIRDAVAKIPDDISLVTSDGNPYIFGDADKKIKLVEFIYTNCPDICPTTTQKMVLLKKDLENAGVFGKKVQFITITIDPYNDSPEVLTKYMDNFEIKNDGNWIFLTGDRDHIKQDLKEIKELADPFKFQFKDPGNGFYIHTSLTFLIDENNQFIKKFPMGEDFNKKDVFNKIMDEI
ncbi:SCO family protein [Bacillus sp. 1NLA3E]|uniref:SCO family protein n=1 Tax=Bacillus sp. 1NLA3E TaxID=666686 RepID=UPI000247E605|nr:SCO family protein [Bacillus sp. 1NLA3E]AGK54305.1 lipoprotein [Bacillus sp. 1NLA3E]